MIDQDLIDRIDALTQDLEAAAKDARVAVGNKDEPLTSDEISQAGYVARLVRSAGDLMNTMTFAAGGKLSLAEIRASMEDQT